MFDKAFRPAGTDEDLDSTGGLAERDSLLLHGGQGGFEIDPAERVQRDGDDDTMARECLAGAGVHLRDAARLRDRCDWRRESRLVQVWAVNRFEQRAGAVPECHPAAGVLGERETAARKLVPAGDAESPRVVEWPVCDRLELGDENVALLLVGGRVARLVPAIVSASTDARFTP